MPKATQISAKRMPIALVLSTWTPAANAPNTQVRARSIATSPDGYLYVADPTANRIAKFTRDGQLVMTLGTKGVAGDGPDTFNGGTDVAVAPNGDIFVADGHVNARVVKFSKDGRFLQSWGMKGSGRGELNTPHAIAIDSAGRIFVGDRANNRIQIFDERGNYLDEWKQFGRPTGLFIDRNDTLYVADDESNPMRNPGFDPGVRIGSAKTGTVTSALVCWK